MSSLNRLKRSIRVTVLMEEITPEDMKVNDTVYYTIKVAIPNYEGLGPFKVQKAGPVGILENGGGVPVAIKKLIGAVTFWRAVS